MGKLAQVNIGNEFRSPFGSQFGVGNLVSVILSNAMIIAGFITFLLFLFGGFSMIIAAGRQNPEQGAKGKQAATAGLVGFIIIFASYWIIKIVEAITGLAILNPTF